MEKERKILQPTDDRPTYEPPRALRLDGTQTGTGGIPAQCSPSGSSATNCEGVGSVAADTCAGGGTASIMCINDGNDAVEECQTGGGLV